MLDDVAARNDELRDQRQIAAELRENPAELRNEKRHQENHHAHGQEGQDDGIDHGRLDLAHEVLLAGAEIGDLAQHDLQKPARLAGADHGDIHGGEIPRPFGQRIGQSRPADDVVVNVAPELLGGRLGSFAAQQSQRPRQRNAAGQQIRQFPRERFHVPAETLRGLSPPAVLACAFVRRRGQSLASSTRSGRRPFLDISAMAEERESLVTVPLVRWPSLLKAV